QGPQEMEPAFLKRLAKSLEHATSEAWISRRSALVAGLGLAAGAAGGVLLGRTGGPEPVRASETIEPVDGRWIDVGAASELVEGQGTRVVAGGVGAYLFRRGDQVTAVSSICSHLPCELWWDGASGHLACPCPPAKFMSDGRPTGAYALANLNKVHVRVTPSGRVEVLGTA